VEPPARRLQDFPPLGQRRLNFEVRAAPDQAFVDVAQETQRERFVQDVGIQPLGVPLERPSKRLRLDGASCRNGKQGRADRRRS